MSQKLLKQPKACGICGKMMVAGESFVWHKTTRATIGAKTGGSYSLREIERFTPKHAYNCFAVKVDAEKRERSIQIAEYARAHGATESEIADILSSVPVGTL